MTPGFSATSGPPVDWSDPGSVADILRTIAFFDPLPEWARQELAQAAQSHRFRAGDPILSQHHKATRAWYLLSGQAQVILRFDATHDLVIDTIDTRGSMIGWSVFRPPYRYTASIRCLTDCETLALPRAAFESLFRRDPTLEFPLLQRAAEVLANRLAQTQRMLVGDDDQTGPAVADPGMTDPVVSDPAVTGQGTAERPTYRRGRST